MLSRKTTILLADIICYIFTSTFYEKRSHLSSSELNYKIDYESLYDYLFENNYEAWFCNLCKSIHGYSTKRNTATRKLKEFLLQLHTGESVASATPKMSWDQREKFGQKYLEYLSEDILNSWYTDWSSLNSYDHRSKLDGIEMFLRNLELDGYLYKNSKLLNPEKGVLDVEQETNLLKHLYSSLSLNDSVLAFDCLRMSEEHYENGNWRDSIANSRHFFELTLSEVADRHSFCSTNYHLSKDDLSKAFFVRSYLEKANLLEKKETEAVKHIYYLISETGNHPYMAEKDQARLLRNLSLVTAQFVLLRLQGFFT
jgi:hypothetical protein